MFVYYVSFSRVVAGYSQFVDICTREIEFSHTYIAIEGGG